MFARFGAAAPPRDRHVLTRVGPRPFFRLIRSGSLPPEVPVTCGRHTGVAARDTARRISNTPFRVELIHLAFYNRSPLLSLQASEACERADNRLQKGLGPFAKVHVAGGSCSNLPEAAIN